jgi:hypothetical protein
MKQPILRLLFVVFPLAIVCNPVTGLAQSEVQNGTPILTIKSGETIYYEPDNIGLPEPEFYQGSWQQWPSTVNKLVSIKHTAFKRQGNEVTYDALLSDKQDGFQEITRFKVTCSSSKNIWPDIKISFFLIGYKKTYSEDWKIHPSFPNLIPEWQIDKSNPNASGEQWLFVNLAENACDLTQ